MSRSYKKNPWSGDRKGKWKKRMANRRVRSALRQDLEFTIQNNDFKKIYDSYDICDFGRLKSWEEFYDGCVRRHQNNPQWFPPPDKKECYKHWLKWYKNK